MKSWVFYFRSSSLNLERNISNIGTSHHHTPIIKGNRLPFFSTVLQHSIFFLPLSLSLFLHLDLKRHLLFQIDPALLQQTLQQGSLLSQPLSVDTGLVSHSGSQLVSAADPSVQANLVLHPLTSLALPPSTITPAQVTMASLSESDPTGTQQVLQSRWH